MKSGIFCGIEISGGNLEVSILRSRRFKIYPLLVTRLVRQILVNDGIEIFEVKYV